MNWIKENPFVAGIIAVCIIVGGTLGFFVYEAYSTYSDAAGTYTSTVDKLHELQNKVPFPKTGNFERLKEQELGYQALISSYQDQISAMQLPIHMDVKPQQFQDDLRTDVNAVRSKADTNGVRLPANFYLGFDPYQSQLPSDKAAPYLDRQLRAILLVVNRLLDFKVDSIDDLHRQPLPEEGAGAGTPGTPENSGRRGSERGGHAQTAGASSAGNVFSESAFTVAFTADQGKVRVAFDSLLSPDQFFVVKAVNIENSAQTGPSKASTAANTAAAAVATPTPAATASSSSPDAGQPAPPKEEFMSVILGREKVRAALAIEIVNFPEKPQPKTTQP